MRFTKLFDSRQRTRALGIHRSFRSLLQSMRTKYPATNPDEAMLIQICRDAVQDFARELRKPDGKVSIERLNESATRANRAYYEYTFNRMIRRLDR